MKKKGKTGTKKKSRKNHRANDNRNPKISSTDIPWVAKIALRSITPCTNSTRSNSDDNTSCYQNQSVTYDSNSCSDIIPTNITSENHDMAIFDGNSETEIRKPEDKHMTSGLKANQIDTSVQVPSVSSSISIITWNILAESYCSRRSHRNLPNQYQKCIFHNKHKRRDNICRIIRNTISTIADVICLQEVDMDEIHKTLQQCGYIGVETIRSVKGNIGSVGRVDACGIYVNERNSPWRIQQHHMIQLDDLAFLSSSSIDSNSVPSSSPSASKKVINEVNDDNTSKFAQEDGDDTNDNSRTTPVTIHNNIIAHSSNMQGIQQAFLRRNVALLVRLHNVNTDETVVVANAHLYWNPYYEYVKLCQAHYILRCANKFLLRPDEPFIFCGDFNSRPGSITHTYLSHGTINAKQLAPWYACQDNQGGDRSLDTSKASVEIQQTNLDKTTDDDDDESDSESESELHFNSCSESSDASSVTQKSAGIPEVIDQFTAFKIMVNDDKRKGYGQPEISLNETMNKSSSIPNMKYLLDATLNKFCRWLRILGQDAALETEVEEKLRTSQGKMILFDRCKNEGRTLVTTSTRLLHRRDCPSSAYCISPQTLPKLEVALVHMLLTHGVILEPNTFLSRCVMCNGQIVQVHPVADKKRILAEYQAPADLLNDNMDVYECDCCKQGYWWCDRPTSSASRVKNTACELYELCLRAGVPCRRDRPSKSGDTNVSTPIEDVDHSGDDDDDDTLFRHLDENELRRQGWDYSIPGSTLLHQRLHVIEWLKDENLECPFSLESVYALKDAASQKVMGELLPFTNVTYDFVNTLDYVFFDTKTMYLTERLYVPQSFEELNVSNLKNGHLLPSDIWPSDHLAVGARLTFFPQNIMKSNIADDNTAHMSDRNSVDSEEKSPGADNLEADLPVENSASISSNSVSESTIRFAPTQEYQPTPIPVNLHGTRCRCGCVPNILGLFEMAALRKQLAAQKSSDN
jgi:mRNA deadenylase 3'-5' endonuclease subunit Ccr4/uncharacterized protein with PIN domain